MNIYAVYEIDDFQNVDNYPTLINALSGAVKSTENADIDKCRHFRYGIEFDGYWFYSHPSGGIGRNIVIFGTDMSLFVHVDNKGKDILVRGKGPTQGSGEHWFAAEKCIWSILPKLQISLSLHYNGENSFLFVNGTEIHKFKANDFEIVPNNLCLANVSKDFSASNMKKAGFNGHIYDFCVDYDGLMLMIF